MGHNLADELVLPGSSVFSSRLSAPAFRPLKNEVRAYILLYGEHHEAHIDLTLSAHINDINVL